MDLGSVMQAASTIGIGIMLFILQGIRQDNRDIHKRINDLQRWSEERFASRERCDERHRQN